jgi:uncharacterized cupredoxin-like copper-binding protein
MPNTKRHLLVAAAAACLAPVTLVFAHGDKPHAKPKAAPALAQKDWGIAGRAQAVKRTINVRMLDTMRFEPSRIQVLLGDTVRFNVRNAGAVLHEFVIGTPQENDAHAQLMVKFPDMEHDEPYMAHVPAGQTGSLVWTFNRPGDFQFACLIAGHYQAGMVGTIRVVPRAKRAA